MNIQSALNNLLSCNIVYRYVRNPKQSREVVILYYRILLDQLQTAYTEDFKPESLDLIRDQLTFTFEEVMDEHWQIYYEPGLYDEVSK